MTALSLGLRPRGVSWSVLLTHRSATRIWVAFAATAALGLVVLYFYGEHVESVKVSCGGEGMPACTPAFHEASFEAVSSYTTYRGLASGVLAYLPLAVAAWAGGALVARERERGTAALGWTQSVSPVRWLATRLAAPALFLVLGTMLLTALFRWVRVSGDPSLHAFWWMDDTYRAAGPVGPATVLLALAGGAFAGMLIGRTLPALGLSFGITGLVQLLGTFYRAELWPKAVRTGPSGALPGDGYAYELGGVVAPSGERIGIDACRLPNGDINLQRCLEETGATKIYALGHPDSHYWPLQLVETGIVLGLTAALTVTVFWLLRRRLP